MGTCKRHLGKMRLGREEARSGRVEPHDRGDVVAPGMGSGREEALGSMSQAQARRRRVSWDGGVGMEDAEGGEAAGMIAWKPIQRKSRGHLLALIHWEWPGSRGENLGNQQISAGGGMYVSIWRWIFFCSTTQI